MSFTRDILQGFIDGYITAGGDPLAVDFAVAQYIQNHPLYQATPDELSVIKSDLNSYRITAQDSLAPTPVSVISISPVKGIQ